MSAGARTSDFDNLCHDILERAWPGVRVRLFEVNFGAGGFQGNDDGLSVALKVSGAEDVLVRHGLLSAEAVASIPSCGQCRREGWLIWRRKSGTFLEAWDNERLLDRLAPILVPELVWIPPEVA